MKTNVRIGMVGCGGIAHAHLAAYQSCENAEIVVVTDLNRKTAEVFAQNAEAAVAASLSDMTENFGLDAVSVCTPPGVHYDSCIPFLRKGIAVLCEKPLADNVENASRLCRVAENNDAVFMPAFCHRFHPPVIEAKKLIEEGVLGRLLLVRIIFGGYKKLAGDHRADFYLSGGGTLIDNGSHAVDIFRFLAADPWRVKAICANVSQKDIGVEDFCHLDIETKEGVFCDFTGSHSFRACGNWVEIYGEKGTSIISYWNEGHPDLSYKTECAEKWKTVDCSSYPDRFVGQAAHFVDCVRRLKQPDLNADDGLVVSKTIAAAYKSSEEGAVVTVGA